VTMQNHDLSKAVEEEIATKILFETSMSGPGYIHLIQNGPAANLLESYQFSREILKSKCPRLVLQRENVPFIYREYTIDLMRLDLGNLSCDHDMIKMEQLSINTTFGGGCYYWMCCKCGYHPKKECLQKEPAPKNTFRDRLRGLFNV